MRFITVNLSNKEIVETEFDQSNYGYFGGRGLIAQFLTDYCDPTCDPLGPDNPLIFTTGYFAGTPLSTSNRLSIGAKSPLTGGIKESNSGGTMARRMTDHKIKVIMFTGQSPDWVYCYVDKNGEVHLEDASEFVGMWTYPTCDAFRERYDARVAISCIGPAGEILARTSSIMSAEMGTGLPCRAGARGGMGAVMGSKHLKALVVAHSDDPYCPLDELTAEQQAEFKELNKTIVSCIKANPLSGNVMPLYGSAAGVDTTGKMGALPYLNFSGKFTPDWERLGTVKWRENLLNHGGHSTIPCQPSCIVRCSNEYHHSDGHYLSAGIEYETVALCGSNLGIFDTDSVCTIDRLCDDMGCDTIDMGNALAVMMDEHVMEFGDAEAAINMVKTALDPANEYGKPLLDGCAAIADYLGIGSRPGIKRVASSKRQAFAAYDPRILRGYGLTWERGPMGADHTSGSAATYMAQLTPEQQADFSLGANCTCDCFMCLFSWSAVFYNPAGKPAIARMAGILAGKEEGPGQEMIFENGNRILAMEYAWNERAGIYHDDDYFYGGEDNFMYHEPAQATGAPYWSIHKGPPPAPATPPGGGAKSDSEKVREALTKKD
ncbi:MAG: hypothetical protein IJH83_01700 [Coriobacteriales bacterium]|nr:hypothetical protein [Coriobacteriales bacterium]